MKSLANRKPCGVLPGHIPASHGRVARAGPRGGACASSAGVRPGAAFWTVASPRLHPQRSAVAEGFVLQAGDAFPGRLAAGIAAGKVVPGAASRVSPCAAGMLQAGWQFPACTAASVSAARPVRGQITTAGSPLPPLQLAERLTALGAPASGALAWQLRAAVQIARPVPLCKVPSLAGMTRVGLSAELEALLSLCISCPLLLLLMLLTRNGSQPLSCGVLL